MRSILQPHLTLKRFANETGLQIFICHFPPRTSKWNKIEHKLFSFISKTWQGEPLVSYEVVLGFIGHTKTETVLKVQAFLNMARYELDKRQKEKKRRKILRRYRCHPDWNYTSELDQEVISAESLSQAAISGDFTDRTILLSKRRSKLWLRLRI